MSHSEWFQADLAIERLRIALSQACGVPANAVTWSYGGLSGEKCVTRIHIRLDVPQGDALADVVTGTTHRRRDPRSGTGGR